MDIPIYSPAYSSSSLSDPPTEPNSPILFHLNDIIKLEDAEDHFDIANMVADYAHTTPGAPSSRATRTRVNGDRRPDPCADEEWVAALRVAHAADQTRGLSDDLSITHSVNLRRTSSRLNRASNTSPATGSPFSSTSFSGAPRSKKRGRSNVRTHLDNVTPDGGIMAIKKEIFEAGDGIGIDSYIRVASPTRKQRRRGRPAKKQKVDSALAAVPGLHGSYEKRESINVLAVTKTASKKKKRPRRPRFAYVIEQLEENKPDKTRESVPPNFTFRYAIPHTPPRIYKEPLRSSRYWSEGAGDPRNFKPIGDLFQRKDGLLTDAVSITESRLRPRKSIGNINPEADPQQPTGKRTLAERGFETEESSDDDRTVTDDEDLEDDEMDDDLDIDSEDIDPSASIGGGEHSLQNISLKRQKLNTGGSSSIGATKKTPWKKQNKLSVTTLQDIDQRIWMPAVSSVDNKFMVPRPCVK